MFYFGYGYKTSISFILEAYNVLEKMILNALQI